MVNYANHLSQDLFQVRVWSGPGGMAPVSECGDISSSSSRSSSNDNDSSSSRINIIILIFFRSGFLSGPGGKSFSRTPAPSSLWPTTYLCYTYIYIYICMYAWMHACMYVCMHACMHACTHACMYVCICVCMYVI